MTGLGNIGETPKLSAIENPVMQPGYRPVSMPMPTPERVSYSPNSLWRTGARAFFEDQRARRVGDILTVIVEITDKAELENSTNRGRDNSESASIPKLGGWEELLKKILPKDVDLNDFVNATSNSKSDGDGAIDREETITTKIAGVVTQVLPNGNMVIEGRQEIRVNYGNAGTHRRRRREAGGHHVGKHDPDFKNRGGPCLLRRTRPDHGRTAAAIRTAVPRYRASVLADALSAMSTTAPRA